MYCKANFWRPTGLGNRLFSWARARVFAEQTGYTLLAPNWFHLRGASIIRGGINYKNAVYKILLFDNFRDDNQSISGIKKAWIKHKYKSIEVVTLNEAFTLAKEGYAGIISFSGRKGHDFKELIQYKNDIRTYLYQIAKNKWKKESDVIGFPFIGLNIRMGNDFKKTSSGGDFLTNKYDYLQTPLGWYLDTLRSIRSKIRSDFPAIIVSDGKASDLQTLLQEPNVSISNSKSAISDLLLLTKSSLLIGSGRSSFSAWASFLGEMPTFTIPGSNLQSFCVSDNLKKHFVGEYDDHTLSSEIMNKITNQFGGSQIDDV
ncbi:MAG: hypothetical protein H3C56_05195 [Chitinophagaceae bacterium]|nr:hypothetical protein [Chitinophagaceae bacterium]